MDQATQNEKSLNLKLKASEEYKPRLRSLEQEFDCEVNNYEKALKDKNDEIRKLTLSNDQLTAQLKNAKVERDNALKNLKAELEALHKQAISHYELKIK